MLYYDIKYPYLRYPFRDSDGSGWIMYSIPVDKLARIYHSYFGKNPLSFFDCGAAVGELIQQAENMGIKATGIDIKKYPVEKFPSMQQYAKYFQSGQIKIQSILETPPVKADLAYCNGTLTYMNESTLPIALSKFKNVKMLIAIHNTTEDVIAARKMGDELLHAEPRLIKPNQWWIDTFQKHGFKVDFNTTYNTFCAFPRHNRTR
ncbi:MAG: hypothetical protein J6L47_01710 [Alphaproteobacteria bacterium]|nr:hypothetical protein [Alphaproteobacteria bacterium]